MQVTVKELRTQPGRIISMVRSGNDITITLRGKPTAKIVPLDYLPADETTDDELIAFGMWRDREDLQDPSAYVAELRKGRTL
ncbi:MAG: type II toxin-antitoxin system prevent-host-death family antitoxin [Clostridiales Family XIII bacterium]|jgi:prevent-host-death family protein|nr:type II toxin-antitoxin system prevent-host-death family antitoxin [Clostridiales Family XIII bacterium]